MPTDPNATVKKKKKNKRGTRSVQKRHERESNWLRKELVKTITENGLWTEVEAARVRLARIDQYAFYLQANPAAQFVAEASLEAKA